jgi:hypothetical protein
MTVTAVKLLKAAQSVRYNSTGDRKLLGGGRGHRLDP